jgi:hypothetical protein
VSEPAEPERYAWRVPADRDADVIGVLAAALTGDFDGAVAILSSLNDQQTTSLCWCLARWFAGELAQDFEDPAGELQKLALALGRGRAA